MTNLTVTATNLTAIPDDVLRLQITGVAVPTNLVSIRTLPALGPHADVPTASVPLVDVGLATNPISLNLTGMAALIQRGVNDFPVKIAFAAQAGAAFAVIYNNSAGNAICPGGDALCLIGGTDFQPIPAVFIGQTDGESLAALFGTNSSARAQLRLASIQYLFSITNTLLCEHVGVRVLTDHPSRGDLRITLVSPQGTRSILQSYNLDTSPGPSDWTYWSTHHFYESSRGDWTVFFSDESADATGSVQSVSLIIEGVAIVDSDADGLDDRWELAHLGSLNFGPQDDPDGDGYSNAREQIMGTEPLVEEIPFRLDLSRWNGNLARLSWPGVTTKRYQVWAGADPSSLTLLTNVPGKFPITEWFAPYTQSTPQFFQVRTRPEF
jgi:subtilisin-like proprotein convertase family protein